MGFKECETCGERKWVTAFDDEEEIGEYQESRHGRMIKVVEKNPEPNPGEGFRKTKYFCSEKCITTEAIAE